LIEPRFAQWVNEQTAILRQWFNETDDATDTSRFSMETLATPVSMQSIVEQYQHVNPHSDPFVYLYYQHQQQQQLDSFNSTCWADSNASCIWCL
jgi:hypothetical protein